MSDHPSPRRAQLTVSALHKKLVQLVHVGKSKLRLDEDTYRAMLVTHGGADSTTGMTVAQLERVLAHLRTCGFIPARTGQTRAGKHRTPHNLGAGHNGDLVKKVEALLTDAGLPWTYAVSMAQRMYRKDRIEFCDSVELAGIITALERSATKRLQQQLQAALAAAGLQWGHVKYIAVMEFGFSPKWGVEAYPQAMSQVLRFLKGELVGAGKLTPPATS